MTKADCVHSTPRDTASKIGRRGFIGTVATALAVGASVALPSAVAAGCHPDAKLLKLGDQAEPLYRAYDMSIARFRPLWDEHQRRINAWSEAHHDRQEGEGFAEYLRLYDEVGLSALEEADEHPDHFSDQLDPLVRTITMMPANTIEGLAVVAKAAKFAAIHIWRASDDDADWDHLCLRRAIDAVIAASARSVA